MGNFESYDRGRNNNSRGRSGGNRGRSSGGRSGGFNRGGSNNRSGGFNRGGSNNQFGRRPTEMHDVVCDKCKKDCQVPFRPSGNKEVLCSDCFRGGNSRPDSRSNNRSSAPSVSPEQIKKINTKLDRILKILESVEIIAEDDAPEDDLELDDGVEEVIEDESEENREDAADEDEENDADSEEKQEE